MRCQRSQRAGWLVRPVLLLSVVVGLAAGCESTQPSSIAGMWGATSFQFIEAGEAPIDVLAEGGSLTIFIAGDNSTAGTLNIPASLAGGVAISLSMVGTATRSGNTVQFDQIADTFVRDMTWTVTGNTMHGTRTDAGVTVDITLLRQ
jgi:hypothetical protein